MRPSLVLRGVLALPLTPAVASPTRALTGETFMLRKESLEINTCESIPKVCFPGIVEAGGRRGSERVEDGCGSSGESEWDVHVCACVCACVMHVSLMEGCKVLGMTSLEAVSKGLWSPGDS